MKEIHWIAFKGHLPKDRTALLIEDHEGNFGIGIWKNLQFENMSGYPLGLPVKWAKILISYEYEFDTHITVLCKAYTVDDMNEIDVNEFYDFENPI